VELLIQNATVVDGSGGSPTQSDVAISGDRISAVGNFEFPKDVPVLDASGLVVAPGFIDIHSHSDFTLVVDPRAVSSITQGVTLEVVGNCGHGCAPIVDPEMTRSNIYGCKAEHEIGWRSVAEYLERLEAVRPAVNVATLVPNGNLRLATSGLVDRPSTQSELREMKRLLAQGLEEGALGYSTGLEYGLERGCSEEEIAELCKVTARAGGFYATHTRNRSGEAVETIAEAIRASALAEVPLQISHISVVARLAENGKWAVEQALDQVENARGRGLDIGFDMHTRLFGTTHLSAVLPPGVLAGKKEEIAARLRSRAERKEMKGYQSIVTALAQGDWERIVVFHAPDQPELSQKSVLEIAKEAGTDPLDAMYDILLDGIDHLNEIMVIAFSYREEDIRPAFDHPSCMVGSDATALAPDGPLKDNTFHGAYTWSSWFFRHFVRDTGVLRMEEAVRRLTSLPAERLGLDDRGVIKPGAFADLAIFDPNLFGERGTTFEPNQIAEGMRDVMVNGEFAVKDGELTGERSGRVLRRRE
jgi:N-acyl-D-amino-acid deacylase